MDKINTIKPKHHWFDINLMEIWNYRDLLWLFVRREIVVVYKQTIMGPLWFFIQPMITTIMFLIVFNGIAGIPADNVPPILFYLGGITAWNYFAESFRNTSDTFTKNAGIFGKVQSKKNGNSSTYLVNANISANFFNWGNYFIDLYIIETQHKA